MWILKNSKDLLEHLKSRSFSQVFSIKPFDFSTLYTTLPHDKLKTRLKETIHKAIDEELQHTDHLFLGVACFTFLNFVCKICGIVA
jgi:hypothetical protein